MTMVPSSSCLKNLSVERVYCAIFFLRNSSSSPIDVYYLNSHILKLAASHIVEKMSYLLNLCINESVLTHCLKLAKVVSLFEKGSRYEYNNYCPISVIPIVIKVFEILINKQVIEYYKTNNFFSDNQHDFRPKSTLF